MLKSSKVKLLIISFLAFFSLSVALKGNAADFVAQTDTNQGSVIVSQNAHPHNLYTAGKQVVIDANTSKDVVVAGGLVNVNGSVADDLIAAGGYVNVKNSVGGSVRIAGGNLNIDGNIHEDLVAVGGNITVSPAASVAGDVVIVGGNITLSAPVHGNVNVIAGNILINSNVDGNVNVKTAGQLQLGPSAIIHGNVNYSGRKSLIQDPNAKVLGAVNYTPLPVSVEKHKGISLMGLLITVLSEILLAYILFAVFMKRFEFLSLGFGESFWKKVGIGLLAFIITPILTVLLLITVVGIYTAILLGLVFLMFILISLVVAMSYFGAWVVSKVYKKPVLIDYSAIAVGIILVNILRLIPILGPIFMFVLLLAGLGSVLTVVWKRRVQQ